MTRRLRRRAGEKHRKIGGQVLVESALSLPLVLLCLLFVSKLAVDLIALSLARFDGYYSARKSLYSKSYSCGENLIWKNQKFFETQKNCLGPSQNEIEIKSPWLVPKLQLETKL